jgi:glutaredoxin
MKLLLFLVAVAAGLLVAREYKVFEKVDARGVVHRAAAGQGRVVLYTTQWCGGCRKARAYLNNRGVSFVERDVERDPGAAGELAEKRRTAGMRGSGVPVLDVDGQLLSGFNERAYSRILSAYK